LSQSNVSNHLACFKGCGLVTDRPGDRQQVFYSIAHPGLRDVLVSTESLLAGIGRDVRLCNPPVVISGPAATRVLPLTSCILAWKNHDLASQI